MKPGRSKLNGKISMNTMVVQTEGMPYTYIGDEIAFMNIENNKYYGLDSVGTRIWRLIGQPRRLSEVIDELLKEYDVERATCEENVLEFMEKLHEENLICIVAEG